MTTSYQKISGFDRPHVSEMLSDSKISNLAPVVQTLDSAILWINHYPLDSSIGFASVYPLDSNLSGGQRYLSFEQLGPGERSKKFPDLLANSPYACGR